MHVTWLHPIDSRSFDQQDYERVYHVGISGHLYWSDICYEVSQVSLTISHSVQACKLDIGLLERIQTIFYEVKCHQNHILDLCGTILLWDCQVLCVR